MPLDMNVWDRIKPAEATDLAASYQKGMNLRSMGMQQDQQERAAQQAERKQKALRVGQAMDQLASLTPEQRAAAYPKIRSGLLQEGVIDPSQSPEQHDEGWFRQEYAGWKASPEYAEIDKTRSEAEKNRAQAAKERAEKTNAGKDMAGNLRKEWTGLPTTKATQDVAQSIERVRNAYANPSPAGDVSLIYSFMKMNDPGSTVREGEFATAQNAAGVPERIRAAWNKAISGERLTEEQRTDFAQQAERMYGGQVTAQKTIDQQYAALAGKYGVDPSVILMKFPEPRELKVAIKKEQEEPGFFAKLFGAKTAQAAGPSPKAKTIRQGGHTYTLNEKTGDYE
jgi:hypothetical protein